jgi:hypothetical protein
MARGLGGAGVVRAMENWVIKRHRNNKSGCVNQLS